MCAVKDLRQEMHDKNSLKPSKATPITHLTDLPEVILDIIFKNMDYPSLYNLKHANRFFAENKGLRQEMDASKLIESTRFVCGHQNTFVLSGNGELYACGNNKHGQLGLYDFVDKREMQHVSVKGKKIAAIAAGMDCTYLLSTDGQVYAAGLIEGKATPYFRHLHFNFSIKQIAVGSQHVLLLSKEGRLYGYGSNAQGQLGLPAKIKTIARTDVLNHPLLPNVPIKKILANGTSTVIEGWDRTLYATGSNESGKIGLGSIGYQYGFTSLLNDLSFSQMGPIKQVDLSETNLLVLFKNGRLYGCGTDDAYELGGIFCSHDAEDTAEEISPPDVLQLSEMLLKFTFPDRTRVEKILVGYKTTLFMLNNNSWYFHGLLDCSGVVEYGATQLTLRSIMRVFWREKFVKKYKDEEIQVTLADKTHNIVVVKKETKFFGLLKTEDEDDQGQVGDSITGETSFMMDLKRPYF